MEETPKTIVSVLKIFLLVLNSYKSANLGVKDKAKQGESVLGFDRR